MRTITLVDTSVKSVTDLPIVIADQQGFFAKRGIKVNVTSVGTSNLALASLVSGEADLAFMQAAAVIDADAAGGNVKIVGNIVGQIAYKLVVGPKITDVRQLSGKKFGTPGPNNQNDIFARYMMDSLGVKDVTFVTVGAQAALVGAITAGQIEAFLTAPPFDQAAVKGGASILMEFKQVADVAPNITTTVITATENTLKKDPELVKGFLAAVLEGTQWMLDNPDKAAQIFAAGSNQDVAVAASQIAALSPFYSKDGKVDPDGLRRWMDIASKYGALKNHPSIESVYDGSFLPNK